MSLEEDERATDYKSLEDVLDEAYAQASTGKGAERHGGGLAFELQPMQVISELLGSSDGLAFQAIKKIREGLTLDTPERQVAEMLGAINYCAGIVIYIRRHHVHEDNATVPVVVTLDRRATPRTNAMYRVGQHIIPNDMMGTPEHVVWAIARVDGTCDGWKYLCKAPGYGSLCVPEANIILTDRPVSSTHG